MKYDLIGTDRDSSAQNKKEKSLLLHSAHFMKTLSADKTVVPNITV